MTREQFTKDLCDLGFSEEFYSEYNRTIFTKGDFLFRNKPYQLEIQLDYHTIRLIWFYKPGRKVSKCYYTHIVFVSDESTADFLSSRLDEIKQSYQL